MTIKNKLYSLFLRKYIDVSTEGMAIHGIERNWLWDWSQLRGQLHFFLAIHDSCGPAQTYGDTTISIFSFHQHLHS